MTALLGSRWLAAGLVALAAIAIWLAPPAWLGHGLVASTWDDNLDQHGPPQLVRLARHWDVSMDGNQASSNQTIYSLRFDGFLELAGGGLYSFALDSDDGSSLWIDDRLVVNNAGRHPRRRIEAGCELGVGEHRIRIDYFQTVGESFLRSTFRPPGQDWQPLPLAWLRPTSRTEFDQAASDRAAATRLGLLALAGLLLAAALGLRIRLAWPGLGRLTRDRAELGAQARALLARPWVQDLLVVAVCLPFYAQTISTRLPWEPYMKGDSIYYANTAVSILRDFDLDQKNQTDERIFEQTHDRTQISLADSNIARGVRSEWYPKHSVLMPLLSVPFYAAWGGFGFVLYNLVSLLALVVAVRRSARLFSGPGAAAVAAVAIGLTPMFHNFAYSYCPDILSALLVTAGLGLALARRTLAAGVLLGLAVWAKLPNALALALVAGWLVATRDWRSAMRFGLGAALALAVFGGLNWYQFGAPWLTGYQRVWVVENGVHLLGDHIHSFSRPFLDGLALQLTHPINGLMPTAAAALVAWPGFFWLSRRSLGAACLIGLFGAATFGLYCVYDFTHASHFSNRFLMPVVATAGIPLACLLERLVGFGRQRVGAG